MNIKIKNAIRIERSVLQIIGKDKFDFLQPLITNDVYKSKNHPIYSLILTAKGRFIADFFLIYDEENDFILLETDSKYKEILLEQFNQYKLHSRVKIKDESENYQCFVILDINLQYKKIGERSYLFQDPRSSKTGFKLIVYKNEIDNLIDDQNGCYDDYEKKCLENLILDSAKFINERSIPLAFRMDEQNAIDFNKGCFLGQETTAIMKNRGTLNKKIFFLESEKDLQKEDQDIVFNGEKIGILIKKISQKRGIIMLDLHHINKCNINSNIIFI